MARKRIVIEVEYSDDGDVPTNEDLERSVSSAVGIGLLSEYATQTVVEKWDCHVEDVAESENEAYCLICGADDVEIYEGKCDSCRGVPSEGDDIGD